MFLLNGIDTVWVLLRTHIFISLNTYLSVVLNFKELSDCFWKATAHFSLHQQCIRVQTSLYAFQCVIFKIQLLVQCSPHMNKQWGVPSQWRDMSLHQLQQVCTFYFSNLIMGEKVNWKASWPMEKMWTWQAISVTPMLSSQSDLVKDNHRRPQ